MIIVNADDFGLSPAVNDGIVECFQQGIISSTTILVNMPYFENAVQLAKINKFEDSIGLHFNMIEGVPLTNEIKRCNRICSNGVFSYKRNSVSVWNDFERSAIKAEFEAQMERLISYGINPSHVDSHEHTHTEIPIFNIIKNSLKKYGINKIRATRNVGIPRWRIYAKCLINTFFSFNGFKMTRYFNDVVQYDINKRLDNIEIMCHPLLDDNKIVDSCRGIILTKQFRHIQNYRQL